MGKVILYSAEEQDFLQKNCTLTRQALTDAFNARFGRNLKQANIAAMCKRNGWLTGRNGRFPKGNVPWTKGKKGVIKPNSGNFKQGVPPHNTVPVGTEAVANGWVKVKVAEPDTWRNKAHLVWEEHHGRPLPKGMLLLHLDCDFTNNNITNLSLISRSELAQLNKKRIRLRPAAVRPAMVAVAKINTAIRKRSKGGQYEN